MRTRFALYAALATVAIGGIAFAADALVVSDAEQIEQLAEDLTEGAPSGRTGAVLRWIDVSREPVLLATGYQTARFEEADDYALGDELAATLEPFGASDLEVVQRSIEIQGSRATLALRVRSGGEVTDATIELARNGQGWLVTSVRTR